MSLEAFGGKPRAAPAANLTRLEQWAPLCVVDNMKPVKWLAVPGLVALLAATVAVTQAQAVPAPTAADGWISTWSTAHHDPRGTYPAQTTVRQVVRTSIGGMLAVEGLGDDEAEDRVAEELEALVVGQAAVLVGVRAVRQGAQEQRLVDVLADHLGEVGDQGIDGPLRHRRNTRCGRSLTGLLTAAIRPGARCARRRA